MKSPGLGDFWAEQSKMRRSVYSNSSQKLTPVPGKGINREINPNAVVIYKQCVLCIFVFGTDLLRSPPLPVVIMLNCNKPIYLVLNDFTPFRV